MVTANSREASVTLWYRPSVSSQPYSDVLMRPSEPIQPGASLSDWESSSDSAACGMEATWPQMPELAYPAQEVDFPQGGALLPPAGHGAKHTRALQLQAARKCQERSSDLFCSTGQNCSHSPGELTGPPAVFKNSPAVRKVKSVTAAEEHSEQVGFQQHQRDHRRAFTPPWYI